jgi:hypothetical protein
MNNILVLSSVHFKDDLWQRPQQLAVQLANLENKVVFLNPVPKHSPILTTEVQDFMDCSVNKPVVSDGVIQYEIVHKIKEKNGEVTNIRDKFIDAIVKKHKIDKILVYLPEYISYLKSVNGQIDIYFDCVDELSGFYATKKVVLLENELVKMSKGIIVTSKTLYVHKSKENPNCVLIPNAVNPEEFMKSYDKPQDILSIKKPIVGYMGAIANWFDQDLMVEVANQNKDKEFLLIGTVYTNVDKLKAVDNIHLLGKREYDKVPAYVNHFDVGIIPFKMEDLIVNTNPIKYFEYLAAGLETVATPMPELIGEPHCFLAGDAESFTRQINLALNNKNIVNEAAYLRQNSWLERAKQIDAFISNENKNKYSGRNQILKDFLDIYNSYNGISPLLEVLKAELLHELGELEQAKDRLFNSAVDNECWETQVRLILEWKCDHKLAEYMSKNKKLTYDIKQWSNLGQEFLKTYAYRNIKQINEAFMSAVQLTKRSEWIQEEVANLYFDLESYKEALTRYIHLYHTYNKLLTEEGYRNFLKVARSGKKELLVADLEKKIADITKEKTLLNV